RERLSPGVLALRVRGISEGDGGACARQRGGADQAACNPRSERPQTGHRLWNPLRRRWPLAKAGKRVKSMRGQLRAGSVDMSAMRYAAPLMSESGQTRTFADGSSMSRFGPESGHQTP